MEPTKHNKMGTQKIPRLLVTMSLPAMFSMLIQALYNIVDSIFVAQINENALTAVSLAFPIQTLILAVSVGTGIGINSLISRRLGEKRKEEAGHAAEHGIILALASWLMFALFGALFTPMFFKAFTSDAQIVEYGCQYIYVVTIFTFGIFLSVNIEKIFQSTGNMVIPMCQNLLGAATNLILDPILIFGLFGFPKLDVLGAAIATVSGQIVGMLFGLIMLYTKNHEIRVSFHGFRFSWQSVKDIYAVGLPSIIMQAVASVLTVCLNGILIGFSSTAVSVLGIYYKLQSFVFMPVFGLNQGSMPIMGYNYGARNRKRLISTVKLACVIAFSIMLVGTLIFWLLPGLLLKMFNASDSMLSIGIPALRLISLSFLLASINIVLSNLFQAMGHGVKSLIVSLIRQLAVILPVAFLLSRAIGVNGVWLAFPIAEVVGFTLSILFFLSVYRNEIKAMPEHSGE